jgi:aryl-alcohol dehydrogenase-like predicted oxidoreductase
MEKLQVSEIEILYLHNERTLLEDNPRLLLDELERLKSEGIYRKLGVSIYTGDILQILRKEFTEIDVFQVPENICDQRLKNASFAQDLMFDSREYIVRSIFLQGLLLLHENEIPVHLNQTKPAIEKLRKFAEVNHVSVVDLCLSYAREISWCDAILVGASSPAELAMIVDSQIELPLGWENEIPKIPNQFIDPRYWN